MLARHCEQTATRFSDSVVSLLQTIYAFRLRCVKIANGLRTFRGDIVLTAIRECPLALEFASDALRKDHDFIVNAVRVSARAAGCVTEAIAEPCLSWGHCEYGDANGNHYRSLQGTYSGDAQQPRAACLYYPNVEKNRENVGGLKR